MWAAVAARSHAVSKIFPFGSGSNEFMLYGTVKYTAKTGQESGKEWAARAELVEDASGELKFKVYQVYLVRHGSVFKSLNCYVLVYQLIPPQDTAAPAS